MLKKSKKPPKTGGLSAKRRQDAAPFQKFMRKQERNREQKNSAAEMKREVMGTPGAEKKHLRMNWK